MASPWSLEKELCGLAKVRSLPKALWRLGVIGEPSPDVILEEVQDWTRAGAETYIYRFRVVLGATAQDVLLKAIVGFSLTQSLSGIAQDWVERRRLLDREGIRTPKLYCTGRALLMEQYVPYNLADFLRETPAAASRLDHQVIRLAAVLDRLGFCPISLFHSLRTDGADVFAVDFGQDLGPPGARRATRRADAARGYFGSTAAASQLIDRRAVAVYAHSFSGRGQERGHGMDLTAKILRGRIRALRGGECPPRSGFARSATGGSAHATIAWCS